MQPQPENTGRQVTKFKAGAEWTGNANGRPKGSRNKLAESFVADLYTLWLEKTDNGTTGGVELLRLAALKNPVAVVQVVASLVPKDFNLKHEAGPSFRALWEAVAKGALPPAVETEDDA